MPEARITLGQCVCYLALAPKSNAAYTAIEAALEDVREGRTVAVPQHIKDGNVRKAEKMSADDQARGEQYQYTHSEGVKTSERGVGMVGGQDYLGVDTTYYAPTQHGFEKLLAERLEEIKRIRGGAGPK
jgi:putative ATPase